MRVGLLLAALALALATTACQRSTTPATDAAPALLPDAARLEAGLTRIELLGAGERPLLAIDRAEGQWRLGDKADWPVDPGLIQQLLADLAAARRVEAKTARPELYPRLGLDDPASAQAKGIALRLQGSGKPWELIVGNAAGAAGGQYVRVASEARCWRIDRALNLPRDPLDWLDRNLVDRPLARIERVEVRPAQGADFELVRRDDRFVVAGAPDRNQDEAHLAEALAGGLDQLKLEDLARDDGTRKPERTLRYQGVDGVDFEIDLWRDQGDYWARLSVSLDSARAKAWHGSEGEPGAGDELARRVGQWQQAFAGRRFRLVPLQATHLTLTRAQILAGRE